MKDLIAGALVFIALVALVAPPGGAQSGGPAAPSPTAPPGPSAGADGLGRLRADRIRYFVKEQVYVATGNVSLTVGEVEIRADSMRLEQGPQVATAEGRVTVRRRGAELVAPVLRYEMRTDIAEATGGVVLTQDGTTVRASRMRFVLRDEVMNASGGVEVTHGGATITAPALQHNARTGDVAAEGGVRVTQPGSTMTGRRLLANLPARRADMREDVTLVRAGTTAEETTITAARMVFRWDVNEGEATDSVIIKQRDKTAWADRATYSEPSNRLVLTGRVILEQLSGEWLLREGLVSPPRDPNERQALASVTRLTCTRLVMTLRERDIVTDGPVRVTQRDRWATGDRGTYTEATRRLVLSGNVRLQESDGQWLQADRVVISLIEETFEAEGNVQTQFTVRPGPTRSP